MRRRNFASFNYDNYDYRDSCIPLPLFPVVEFAVGERDFVYNVELVRQLCHDINDAKDNPQKEELLDLLQAVIRENQEEVRIRMAFLAKKYANAVSDTKAAD